MLVEICGLPGAGKSTVASGVADRRSVVLLRIDAIEAALWRNGLDPADTGVAAYGVAHAIALPHLQRGHVVLADAVSGVEAARQGWRETAERAGVPLRVVEAVCPDPEEHRRRVEARLSDLPGFVVPTWASVQATAAAYEPRTDDRLVLDTRQDPASGVERVLAYLDGAER